jgi:4-hydroxybenzoyl-CoA thioesterase
MDSKMPPRATNTKALSNATVGNERAPAKGRVNTFPVQVEFGDCDPARIVFYPNFLRWIDAAGHAFFLAAGVPPWHELERTSGLVGTPLVDLHVKFIAAARWGDRLVIRSTIREWRSKTFVMQHEVLRGDELLLVCEEIRVFVRRVGPEPMDLRAVPVPQDIRARCERTTEE